MKKWYAKFLCLTLFFPALASATALPNVFVDEVDNDDPRHEEGAQWIEITNRTREEMDTRGWILPGLATGGESVKLTQVLKPNETLVVRTDSAKREEVEVPPSLPPSLSELVSDPEDGGEWVELFNPRDTNVDLSSFKLSDASGKKIALIGTIEPSEYFVVNLASSLLNNSGDTLNLIDINGAVLDSVTYGEDNAPKKGESFARDLEDHWNITTPTKGLPNLFPEPEVEITAEEQVEEEEEIIVAEENEPEPESEPEPAIETIPTYTGTITAPPGLFGSQIAYISGYQLYLYKADWPELAVGDTVRVKGDLGESRSETRIKLASGNDLVVTGVKTLVPETVSTKELTNLKTGTLVTIAGKVTTRADRTLTIEDAEGTVDSVFIDAIDLDLKSFMDQEVIVTGIVRTLNANPRLYPRSAEDIVLAPALEPEPIVTEPQEPTLFSTTRRSLPKPLIGGGFVVASAGSGMLFYLKHKLKLLT